MVQKKYKNYKMKIEKLSTEGFRWSAIIIGLLITLFVHNCMAQTFTNNSPAVKVGDYANNGTYTVSWNMATDYGFHWTQSGVQLCSYGDNFIYLNQTSYTLTWVTTFMFNGAKLERKDNFDLSGTYGYTVLADKKPHKLTFRRTATRKDFILDSVLVQSVTTVAQAGFTAGFWLSSTRDDMKASGTITGFTFSPTYDATLRTVSPPAGIIDTVQTPLGWDGTYNNCPTPVQQYATYPRPVYHAKANLQRNSLCVELKYMAGFGSIPGTNINFAPILRSQEVSPRMMELMIMNNSVPAVSNDYTAITNNGKILMSTLAQYYNTGIRFCSNINSFYSDWTRSDYCFDCEMMKVAATFPTVRKDWGSAMVQTTTPENVQLDQANYYTPLAYFDPIRNMSYNQGQALKSAMSLYGVPDTGTFTFEDKEGLKYWGDTKQFTDRYNYMLQPMWSLFPSLKSTTYDTYSFWWQDTWPLFPQSLIGNNGKSSMSQYIEQAAYWNTNTGGTIHGMTFTMKAVNDEISKGYKHQTFFCSPGWNADITQNLSHAQWSGLLGIDLVLGSEMVLPAYFTISQSGVQNRASYCDIPCIPAFGEAAVSNPKYYNILLNGDLVKGTTAGVGGQNNWDYRLWTGDAEILTVAKKLGNEYIIATTHQKSNFFMYRGVRNVDINPVINGVTVPMVSRSQCTLYYYDSSKPIVQGSNPIHLTGKILYKHLSRYASNPSSDDNN